MLPTLVNVLRWLGNIDSDGTIEHEKSRLGLNLMLHGGPPEADEAYVCDENGECGWDSGTIRHPFRCRVNASDNDKVDVGVDRDAHSHVDVVTIYDPSDDSVDAVTWAATETSAELSDTSYLYYLFTRAGGGTWSAALTVTTTWPPTLAAGTLCLPLGKATYAGGEITRWEQWARTCPVLVNRPPPAGTSEGDALRWNTTDLRYEPTTAVRLGLDTVGDQGNYKVQVSNTKTCLGIYSSVSDTDGTTPGVSAHAFYTTFASAIGEDRTTIIGHDVQTLVYPRDDYADIWGVKAYAQVDQSYSSASIVTPSDVYGVEGYAYGYAPYGATMIGVKGMAAALGGSDKCNAVSGWFGDAARAGSSYYAVDVQVGGGTPAAGEWAIYGTSTRMSYLAGGLTIGGTTEMVNLTVTGTLTVGDSSLKLAWGASGGDIYVTSIGLRLQPDAGYNIGCFGDAASGETPTLGITGRRSGDSARTLTIGISSAANDTALFSGVSDYRFAGTVNVNGNYVLPAANPTDNYALFGTGGAGTTCEWRQITAADISGLTTTFLGLTDVDCASYSGKGGYMVRVNESGSAVDDDTVLLLHCNGTDEGTTFSDSALGGNAPHTVSPLGSANTETSQKKFGSASAEIPDSSSGLAVTDDSDLYFAGKDVTIEFFFRLTAKDATLTPFIVHDTDNSNFLTIQHRTSTGMWAYWYTGGVLKDIGSEGSDSLSLNVWYHYALTRNGNTWRQFLEGNKISETTLAESIPNFTGTFKIGKWYNTDYAFNGYIDEVRVSTVCRYTANFTPPSAEFSEYIGATGEDALEYANASCSATNGLRIGSDASLTQYLEAKHNATAGFIETSTGALNLQYGAGANVALFANAASTETPTLNISGYKSGDALRTLSIGISTLINNRAQFSGVAEYEFTASVTNGNCRGPFGNLSLTATSNGTYNGFGLITIIASSNAAGVTNSGALYGCYVDSRLSSAGTGTLAANRGIWVSVGSQAGYGGTMTAVTGCRIALSNVAGAQGTTWDGILATSASVFGNSTAGTITSVTGIESNVGPTSGFGGTITTLYGMRVNPLYGAGTITTAYGLYFDNPTRTVTPGTEWCIYAANTASSYLAGNLGLGTSTFGTSAAGGVLALGNGATAPASSPANIVQCYCADQTAGNATLFVRTELGDIIKLYKETALTAQLTTVTHTEPGTPDYDIQDLTNSGGYGFATKDEGNSALKVIANLQTRLSELETRLKAHGLIA